MEISSFNHLFAEAQERSIHLDTLHQNAGGEFVAAWRATRPHRLGPSIAHQRPFDAARDAFVALLDEPKTFNGIPIILDSSIGPNTVEIKEPRHTVVVTNIAGSEEGLFG